MNYIQQQYPTDIGPHACNLCPEQFAVSSGLFLHKLSNHSQTNISALLIDLLENEVLNSSDNEYCYSFVFTTKYYRTPNTIIKTEPFQEDQFEIQDAMSFFEESKPIIQEIQRTASPESIIAEALPKSSYNRINKIRKICPICRGRFHPQGLYRHIRMMHNRKYSISKGRAKLVRTVDCGTDKADVPLQDILVEIHSDGPVLPEAKQEIQPKQIPMHIAKNRMRKKCSICGQRFHPQGLYRHMLTIHNIKYSVRGGRQQSTTIVQVKPEVDNSLPSADKDLVEDPLHTEVPTLPEEIPKRSTSHKLRKMCPICYRRLHPQGLYRHLRVMHNTVYSIASGRPKNNTINESNVETSFVACDVADTVEIKSDVDAVAVAPELVTIDNRQRSPKVSKLCPICGLRLHPQGLYRHLLLVHNTRYSVSKGKINLKQSEIKESSIEKPTMSPITQKRMKCPLCDRFYHQRGLSRHLKNAHDQSEAEIAAIHKRYRVQPLQPLIPTPHDMPAEPVEPQAVVKVSNKSQFLCPMCDEKLECQDSFRQHLRQSHQFPISTTDKLIDPKQSRRILSSNLRPCPLCGCGLHPQSITRHLRSIHKSSKDEVLALSRLMRVEQRRREAQKWRSRQSTDELKDSDNNPIL